MVPRNHCLPEAGPAVADVFVRLRLPSAVHDDVLQTPARAGFPQSRMMPGRIYRRYTGDSAVPGKGARFSFGNPNEYRAHRDQCRRPGRTGQLVRPAPGDAGGAAESMRRPSRGFLADAAGRASLEVYHQGRSGAGLCFRSITLSSTLHSPPRTLRRSDAITAAGATPSHEVTHSPDRGRRDISPRPLGSCHQLVRRGRPLLE